MDAKLFSASKSQQMVVSSMLLWLLDFQPSTAAGIRGLSQLFGRLRALTKGRETVIERTGGLLRERLEVVFDE